MNYRHDKRPKRDITRDGDNQQVPAIEAHVIGHRAETPADLERIRGWMVGRTADTIVLDLQCHPSLVKLYERRYGVRAMRVCKTCRASVPFDQMVMNKIGQVLKCKPCDERKKAKPILKGRALEEQEYREVPSIVYQACRLRMSDADGINGWLRPQVAFLCSI